MFPSTLPLISRSPGPTARSATKAPPARQERPPHSSAFRFCRRQQSVRKLLPPPAAARIPRTRRVICQTRREQHWFLASSPSTPALRGLLLAQLQPERSLGLQCPRRTGWLDARGER